MKGKNTNITLLYVDDEEINLFIFKKRLETKYNIITATSGKEGLQKLDNHSDDITVVVSDMKMPLMNGIEFISKAREKYHNIAYFILTGFDFNNEIESALDQKVIQKYFTKPLDVNMMVKAINEVVEEF